MQQKKAASTKRAHGFYTNSQRNTATKPLAQQDLPVSPPPIPVEICCLEHEKTHNA
jgi:hypothetical protein